MTDLNALLKDFFDNRLSYKQVYREKFEALLSAMVAEIEALKVEARYVPPTLAAPLSPAEETMLAALNKAKRGPGRPPKDDANG